MSELRTRGNGIGFIPSKRQLLNVRMRTIGLWACGLATEIKTVKGANFVRAERDGNKYHKPSRNCFGQRINLDGRVRVW